MFTHKKYLAVIIFLLSATAFSQNTEKLTLDDFINIQLHKNQDIEPYAESYYNSENSKKFKYINLKNISANFKINDASNYLENTDKIKKMQNLAEHISSQYKVDLINAENIVLTSFYESKKQNIEPLLILSLIGIESTYNITAKSQTGAIGLAQIIPTYHQEKISNLSKDNLNIWSIKGNIKVGIQILKEYINASNGNIPIALQKYNGTLYDTEAIYSKKVLSRMQSLNKIAKT